MTTNVTMIARIDTVLVTSHQALGGVGIQKVPRDTPAVTAKPMIIMNHTSAAAAGFRSGATCLASNASRDVPVAPVPTPMAKNPNAETDIPSQYWLGNERCAQCSENAAQTQNKHAADDPGCPSTAHIGTVADARARQLYDVMNGDQKARDRRSHRQFDHHDAIQRRRGQHHDPAQRGLYQAQSNDMPPTESGRGLCSRR